MSSTLETRADTLGPLTPEQRIAIMEHARLMQPSARRTFRRLLVLAQNRGLATDVISRTALQAHEHDA
jgi:hypothetical protein